MNKDIVKAFMGRIPYADGKDDKGIYQDAIIVENDTAFWLYHGNCIASYDGNTILRSFAGWETVTTKKRLNMLPGSYIYRKNWKMLENGKEFEDAGNIYNNYHKIDGWRGYSFPLTCIAGASDTGTWSDSPANSHSVLGEIDQLRNFLKSRKIPSSLAWGETSNVFCIKRYVQVHPKFRDNALLLVKEFLHNNETDYIHTLH